IEKARAELDAIAARSTNPSVRTELVVGPPEESLCGFAETERSELIVIAAHSREDSLLGHTAENIVQRSVVPVLVVRDPAPWLGFAKRDRALRLLLSLDESASSDLGIEWVRGMRARGPVEVVLGAIYYTDEAAAHYGLGSRHLVDRDPEIELLLSRDLM